MSKIVNLRTRRKQQRRAEERVAASLRAAATGETAAAQRLRATEAEQAERHLDQHRRTPAPEE